MPRTSAISAIAAVGLTPVFPAPAEAATLLDILFSPKARPINALTVDGAVESLPACRARDGARVQYVAVSTTALGGMPHSYKIRPGTPDNDPIVQSFREIGYPTAPGSYIAFAPSFFNGMTHYGRQFIIAHECGHHMLGHPDQLLDGTAGDRHQMERAADCAAVRRLQRHFGYSAESVVEGLKVLAGFGSVTETHPSGASRVRSGMRCVRD